MSLRGKVILGVVLYSLVAWFFVGMCIALTVSQ
jgi:hypothetical protein